MAVLPTCPMKFETFIFIVGLAALLVGTVFLVVNIEKANRNHYDE